MAETGRLYPELCAGCGSGSFGRGRAVLGLRGLLREPVAVLRRALRGRTWGICESGREAAGGLRRGTAPFRRGMAEANGKELRSSERFGEILPFSGIREFYPVELIKSAVCSLSGVTLSIKSRPCR